MQQSGVPSGTKHAGLLHTPECCKIAHGYIASALSINLVS
jgi:hypothetical protein